MPSAKLQLPRRLEDTLKQNQGLHGAVLLSLSELAPWIADNKLPFFPEYTDHGPDHINEVFVSAEALIRDEAWPHMTPEDVAVLVLGILLHDCAMHLSEEGFVALLQKKDWAAPVSSIDTVSWRNLWDDFLREAARFDEKRLKKLFGDTEPAKPPPLDAQALTRRDRLLIGEFLRRHHPRLAHEIALQGVPGPTTTPLRLQNIERKLADLGGLVARSHGMPLRSAADLLDKDERRETRNVHAPFLMSVLRIADYLQIHAERAPKKLLQVRALQSPVSVGEWKKHEAIETIHNRHEDPEALYVKALPKDGATYVGLRRLFASIQDELDDVWAVLGEVYGRFDELRDLGIMVRRLRSNLDDEKAFAKTVNYVPGRAEFQAAGADLLKLLVEPLYGDRPEIGIRELLQNAIDACRELEDYLKQHPDMPKPELTDQEADVVIALEKDGDGRGWLRVIDRGIGMTPDVVREYFLKAGASFRNSDAWHKQHTDKDGTPRVARTGRFGIGVLAAFLLGDRLEVSTRHVTQSVGTSFTVSIDDDGIDMLHDKRPVGTSVSVRVSDRDRLRRLFESTRLWDWHCLGKPRVARLLVSGGETDKRRIELGQSVTFPPMATEPPPTWRQLREDGRISVQWCYPQPSDESLFICNGIRVQEQKQYYEVDPYMSDADPDFSGNPGIGFATPTLSVFDPDGRVPLNLQRTGLAAELPFKRGLFEDIRRDFVAHALVYAPSATGCSAGVPAYSGVRRRGAYLPWRFFWNTSAGWGLADIWHFENTQVRSLLFPLNSENSTPWQVASNERGVFSVERARGKSKKRSRKFGEGYLRWLRAMVLLGNDLGALSLIRPGGRRVVVARHAYEIAQTRKLFRDLQSHGAKEDFSNEAWVVLALGNCPPEREHLDFIISKPPHRKNDTVVEWYLEKDSIPRRTPSGIARTWAEIVKDPIIPFDLDERRRVLAHAYERLAPYVAAHEELLKRNFATRPTEPTDPDDDDDDDFDDAPDDT